MIAVLAAGALTTVQDLGRPGAGALGIAPSGAFDPVALRIANAAVGNERAAAALEVTLVGPTLRFERDAVIAIAGARFDAQIGDRAIPYAQPVAVRAGSELVVGRALDGARAIVAVRGGIDAPATLGSRSTHVAASLGPPPLRAGDVVGVGDRIAGPPTARAERSDHAAPVRALLGPQASAFDLDGFFGATWRVTTRADRTGVRLDGPALRAPAEIDPEPTTLGAIQVPPDGAPIVLGPDRPITGGYAKIATVIEADVHRIARARPGDTLRFARTTLEQARAAWSELERAMDA